MQKSEEYTPLATSPNDDSFDNNDLYNQEICQRRELLNSRYLSWACLVVAVLSAINVVLLPFSLHGAIPLLPSDLDKLPYPDQRVGLHRVFQFSAPSPPLYHSWPDQIVRLSQKYQDAAYGTGTQVVLSSKDVTIMRFLIPTRGSPACAIAWYSPSAMVSSRGESIQMEGDVSQVEVWSVIAANASASLSALDLDDVSWSKRPIRGELLGTLDLSSSPNTTTVDFACPTDDGALVVELRCYVPQCRVKFDQVSTTPKYGFELIRRP